MWSWSSKALESALAAPVVQDDDVPAFQTVGDYKITRKEEKKKEETASKTENEEQESVAVPPKPTQSEDDDIDEDEEDLRVILAERMKKAGRLAR